LSADGRTYVVIGECREPWYSIRLPLTPPPGQAQLQGVSVVFGAAPQGRTGIQGYRLDADAKGWELLSIRGAGRRTVARGRASAFPSAAPVTLLIKRRDLLLTVALDGRMLAEVADAEHFAGLVAVDPVKSAPGGEPAIQTISRLYFEDSFMRPQDDLTLAPWAVEGGQWRLHSVREDVEDMDLRTAPEPKQPQSERSVNPFCVSAYAEKSGLLTTGYWFWDDVQASISLRDPGTRAAGLAFNVRSPDDFFLLRWENGAETVKPTCVQLLRIRAGKTEELAAAWVNGQRDQWYTLGVRTCGRRIQALLDQAVIMDVRSKESLGGKIGLYVEGGDAAHEAFFDDVVVRSISGYDYDDEAWLKNHVASRDGDWESQRVERPSAPANFAAVLRSRAGRMVVGHDGWPAPLLSARVSAPGVGQRIGFEAGLGGSRGEPYRVTLAQEKDGPRLAVSRIASAGEQELASCRDFALPKGGTIELKADLTHPGEMNVYLDGQLRLHVVRGEAGAGGVALFAQQFSGAEFRDLRVAFERDEDLERPPAKEIFRDDPFMKHWSSPQGAWWPVEGRADAWWHVGDFYGRSEVEIPLDPRVLFVHAATDVGPNGGYALVQEKARISEQDGFKLRLLRQGQEVASALVVPSASEPSKLVPVKETLVSGTRAVVLTNSGSPKLVLVRETPYIWVTVNGQEVLAFRDPAPLTGTKVSLSGMTADELGKLQLRRYHVRDYYFEEAPADWYQVGKWKVTTRFSCDPRWSFMTALATQNAALFNKFRYAGDVTLEAYMGTRMGTQAQAGRYPRIGDFNLALCREMLDLNGGYNFIVCGWDPFWSDRDTYLLKAGKEVAQTTERLLPNARRENTQDRVIPVPWISGGRDVHGAWYYIKARKCGGELSSYVDNHLAYSYNDPDPLQQFDPAIWTYGTQIVVARVKISYQKKVIPGRLVAPPAPEDTPSQPEVPAPLITSETHPGFFDDFEGGQRGWHTYAGQQGAALRIARAAPASRGQCLQVTNPGTGGLMEAIAPLADARIRPADARLVAFDYRVPSDVKVNLFFKVAGQYYYVHMTGPDEADAFFRRLGELPVQADGKWHRAEFPLAASYRRAGGDLKALVESAVFGNLHRGLLQAGIGGNGPGATYYIDNFEVVSAGSADFRAACREADVGKNGKVASAVDEQRATVPSQQRPLERQSLASGEWFCHARVTREDGKVSAVAHLPFLVAVEPLQVVAAAPSPGSDWGYGPVELQFSGPNAPFLDVGSLKLTVNRRAVAAAPGLFEMDWLNNRLRINLQAADVTVPPGEQCRMELAYADQLGRPDSFRADYVASLAENRTGPSGVTLEGYVPPEDFESGLGSWEGSRDTALMRDDSTAASGKWSLKVENLRWDSPFMASALKSPFSAGLYPIVEFDYKVHDGVQFDMVANNVRGYATVGLTDRSHYGSYINELPDFRADDAWHHAEVNLLAGLKKVPYVKDVYRQQWLAFGDFGYRGNSIGTYYHLDNFRLVPLASGLKELSLRWKARDAAGIKGYSYLWSARPDDNPDDTIQSTEEGGSFRDLPAPDAYFHIKACNAADGWGPISHFRFRVDASTPRVVVSPADGARSASSQVSVAVQDADSGVDPGSLTLTIGGRTYQPSSRGVAYESEAGKLVWNWVRCRPMEQRSIPNGAVVEMTVSARDFAGNPAPDFQSKWVMDYSLDKEPPTAPVLASTTMAVKAREDFEDGTGQWRNARGNEMSAQVRQVWRDESNGDHCLEIFAVQENSFFDTVATEEDYDLATYPVLSFDYRMPESLKVNMQVRVNGQWYEVKMTAPRTAYTVLGEVPGIVADNAWHHVSVDLYELAKKALPDARAFTVNSIVLGDPARNGNRRNARWFVDSFMIGGYGKPDAECQWRAEDITGVPGYSVVFDRQMGTVPPRQINAQAESGRFAAAQAGIYWFHVAACDSNGNWSKSRHLAYTVAPKAPAQPAATAPALSQPAAAAPAPQALAPAAPAPAAPAPAPAK
jgi:hypothetical protein